MYIEYLKSRAGAQLASWNKKFGSYTLTLQKLPLETLAERYILLNVKNLMLVFKWKS